MTAPQVLAHEQGAFPLHGQRETQPIPDVSEVAHGTLAVSDASHADILVYSFDSATRFRPARLAAYIAASARATS